MAPNVNDFLNLTTRYYQQQQQSGGKVSSAKKAENTYNVVMKALQMFFDFAGDEQAVSEEAKKANNIDKSSKKVKESTDEAIAKYDKKIEELQKNIEANLKKAEEANEERERILKELENITTEIEKQKEILNDPNSEHKDRVAAIGVLYNLGASIQGLLDDSAKLAKTVETAQGEIEVYSNDITKTSDKAEATVSQSETELAKQETEAATHVQTNQQLDASGKATAANGAVELKAAQAAPVVNAVAVADATRKIESGTKTQAGATKNITQLTETCGQIKTNLAELTPEKIGIGNAKTILSASAGQITSAWGLIGTWTEEYSAAVGSELENYKAEVQKADEIVANEQEEKTESKDNKETQQNYGAEYAKTLSGAQSDALALEENNPENKVFNYDTENLKKLFDVK